MRLLMAIVHCLEVLRTSLMCNPDLTPFPYYWSGRQWHDITVASNTSRECIDWDALQESIVPRKYDPKELIKGY